MFAVGVYHWVRINALLLVNGLRERLTTNLLRTGSQPRVQEVVLRLDKTCVAHDSLFHRASHDFKCIAEW